MITWMINQVNKLVIALIVFTLKISVLVESMTKYCLILQQTLLEQRLSQK